MYDPKGAGQSFTYVLMLGYRVLGNVYVYVYDTHIGRFGPLENTMTLLQYLNETYSL